MTKHTPLHDVHARLGASFTDFGGWDMPLKYGSELAEHRAVREAAGIFDLSHMGEVRVIGADAGALLDYALVAKYSSMPVGKAKYGVLVDAAGGLVDDLITYRIADDEFLVVPNASNTPAVVEALTARAEEFRTEIVPDAAAEVADESADTALIAVQGPESQAILEAAGGGGGSLDELGYYAWQPLTLNGVEIMLARTGYTGEDGFELYLPNASAEAIWELLFSAAEKVDGEVLPCGLAARDSLRLEAGMPLYGNELSLEHSPLDAGLARMVELNVKNKEHLFAREALEGLLTQQPARVLAGLTSEGRRAARQGATVLLDGEQIGEITSGQPSPTLGHPIALAYLDREHTEPGTAVSVDIRGKSYDFTVTELPFYRRKK
ncbi:glycine cleavage system aminomethyltransferase GcvT [Brevibacterium luteolum]|uniref:glycine cleavage system aminomethyltransferase GcvT n=1 Tax=Brevibacterium luteolum TaxID=199591 RepID=UPI0021AEA43D|nr:glycine cleavage system aminomethyltransferase GcvT [Brevibacterium luteolum]MCT1873117.1 glycine cleavage system aminomethyltransferase GcvT [Brevibacterium luteolum]MCT1889353.1 glycine cleavage system aminomethyltransferase GcvT [Brevibacterium luteolum]MCT1892938.1 glycine cleavage system aminomethyltransferase GcvT [Brevibacterium luteolum]MCT1923773.1 glycine cleavage system aminomethyltransferase GcvT [Brevibacterium luteolum]